MGKATNEALLKLKYCFFEIDGRKVRYVDTDSKENSGKPEILLFHGWAAPAETYRLIIDHLAARCRVVVPDLPGFGGSEEPATPWGVDDFVKWALRFIEKVGLKAPILIGHSHGGRMIIKIMNVPNRKFEVEKIILMDSAGIKPKRSLKYYIKVYSFKIAKKLFPKKAEEMKKKSGSDDYRKATPVMRDTLVKLVNEDLTTYLKNIDVPTLLIWGGNDTDTPMAHARIMEREIPDAGLVELSGAGHFAFAERWGQCALVLDSFIYTD